MKHTYEIDGNKIYDLESFYSEFSDKVLHNNDWGHNLDAFNDVLYGGFGTPAEGYILVWSNSLRSKIHLKQAFDTLVSLIGKHKDIELVLQ